MLSICEPDKLDASFCRHVIILNSISFLINFIVQFAYSVRFSHHWKATQHFIEQTLQYDAVILAAAYNIAYLYFTQQQISLATCHKLVEKTNTLDRKQRVYVTFTFILHHSKVRLGDTYCNLIEHWEQQTSRFYIYE